MDDKELESSGEILIQCGTKYQPAGWKEVPAEFTNDGKTCQGFKILNTGSMPWQADPTYLKITLKNSTLSKAILLDVAGFPVKELPLKRSGSSISLSLPEETLYLILK